MSIDDADWLFVRFGGTFSGLRVLIYFDLRAHLRPTLFWSMFFEVVLVIDSTLQSESAAAYCSVTLLSKATAIQWPQNPSF